MKRWLSRWPFGAAAVVVSTAVAIGALAMIPASSAPQAQSAAQLQCTSREPCFATKNVGTGSAIRGVSVRHIGIVGRTFAFSASPLQGGILEGLRGTDLSVPGHGATINYSSGVVGESETGFGITGFGKIHGGVVGNTANPSLRDNYGSAGVEGFDNSSDGGLLNAGVEGGTVGGSGVFGFSTFGNGVRGITTNPSSRNSLHRAAVFGIDSSTDGGGLNFGVAGFSPGTGIAGISISPPTQPGAPIAPAVAAVCENGGAAIQAVDSFAANYNLLMTLDCSGNLTVKGKIVSGSDAVVAAKSSAGPDLGAYQGRQTEPTIEDFGEGQLVDGRAAIQLNRDFASTIDRRATYLVFITPEGDNRGLFVDKKTGDGFEVRESQQGRSTISFSYRIVARPFGSKESRLPPLSAVLARQATAARHPLVKMSDALRQLGQGAELPVPASIQSMLR
jgi:hypothetical protein